MWFKAAYCEGLIVLFADLPVMSQFSRLKEHGGCDTYRIDGGTPAGIFMRPSGSGLLEKRKRIARMTIHGKRSTAPKGTETEEFPFNQTRR